MLRSELVLGTSKTPLMLCSELVLGTSKTQMKQILLSDVEGEPVKIKKNADTSEKQTCVRQNNSETLVSFPHRAQSAVKVTKF